MFSGHDPPRVSSSRSLSILECSTPIGPIISADTVNAHLSHIDSDKGQIMLNKGHASPCYFVSLFLRHTGRAGGISGTMLVRQAWCPKACSARRSHHVRLLALSGGIRKGSLGNLIQRTECEGPFLALAMYVAAEICSPWTLDLLMQGGCVSCSQLCV